MRFKIRRALVPVILVILAVVAAFGPSLMNGFTNWDDDRLITANPLIRSFSLPHLSAMFSYAFCGTYIPLTLLTFCAEYNFFGLNPLPYHLTNILLHALNALLAGILVWLLSGRRRVALVAALLFAVHPLRVESVAWVTERKDVLFAAFYLAALIAYVLHLRRRSTIGYILSLVSFILSGLAKGAALTLPIVLVLLDYIHHRPLRGRAVIEKIPFVAIAAAFGLAAVLSQQTLLSHAIPLVPRLFLIAWVPVFYLFKTLVPLGLSPLYPYPVGFPARLPWSFIISPLGVVLLTVAVVWSRRKTNEPLFAALFFLVTLLPVGQIITVGGPEIAANRYTYLPLLGVFYLMAEGFDALARRWRRGSGLLSVTGLVIIGMLALASNRRCAVWRDSFSLWNDVLARYPEVPEAYSIRGLAFAGRGDFAAAVRDYSKAIGLKPDFGQAYNNRAIAYRSLGEPTRALEDFDRGIAAAPRDPELYYNRGNLWMDQGLYDRAIRDYSAALGLDDRHVPALNNRGNAYCQSGAYESGIADYKTLLSIEPENHQARYNRAVAYFIIGDFERAWQDVRQLQQAGYAVNPFFLDDLRRRSGRDR